MAVDPDLRRGGAAVVVDGVRPPAVVEMATAKTDTRPFLTRRALVGDTGGPGLLAETAEVATAVLLVVVGLVGEDAIASAVLGHTTVVVGVLVFPARRGERPVARRPMGGQVAVPVPLVGDTGRPTVATPHVTAAFRPVTATETVRRRATDVVVRLVAAAFGQRPGRGRQPVTGAASTARGPRLGPAPLEEVTMGVAPRPGRPVPAGLHTGVVETVTGGGQMAGVTSDVAPRPRPGVVARAIGAARLAVLPVHDGRDVAIRPAFNFFSAFFASATCFTTRRRGK